jgi:phage shock protein PspC (stress-responsive transcriptional regulator)
VAAGLAEYLDIEPVIVRVGWVLAVVFGLPLAAIGYLILWVIMPSPEGREAGDPGSRRAESSRDNSALLLGLVLVIVGILFLLPHGDFLPWFGWRLIHFAWPIVLILGGILLLMRSLRAGE